MLYVFCKLLRFLAFIFWCFAFILRVNLFYVVRKWRVTQKLHKFLIFKVNAKVAAPPPSNSCIFLFLQVVNLFQIFKVMYFSSSEKNEIYSNMNAVSWYKFFNRSYTSVCMNFLAIDLTLCCMDLKNLTAYTVVKFLNSNTPCRNLLK